MGDLGELGRDPELEAGLRPGLSLSCALSCDKSSRLREFIRASCLLGEADFGEIVGEVLLSEESWKKKYVTVVQL